MCTHSSSKLNSQALTIAVPFVVPFGANYPNELNTLGDHFRRKRLATRLGVDESTLFRWESDRGRPGTQLLARLGAVLGVPADSLLDRAASAAVWQLEKGLKGPRSPRRMPGAPAEHVETARPMVAG